MGHQKMGRCAHFDGLPFRDDERGKKCLAGVDYRAHVGGPDAGWMARAPCTHASLKDTENVVPCPLYRDPTQAEIDADEAEFQTAMSQMRVVMTAIKDWRKKPWGKSLVRDCPVCSGANTLHLSQAAYNGHVHGRCITAGCVSWME